MHNRHYRLALKVMHEWYFVRLSKIAFVASVEIVKLLLCHAAKCYC